MNTESPPPLIGALGLKDRAAVVLGGGPVARRRAAWLLDCGASVHLVAPEDPALLAWLPGLPQASRLRWSRRRLQPEDLQRAWLVFACTGDAATDARVARLCQERGIWCALPQEPSPLRALTTARMGPLQIALLAPGQAEGPMEPRLLASLEASLGAPWAAAARLLRHLQQILGQRPPQAPGHPRRLDTWLAPALLEALARADWDAVAQHTRDTLGLSVSAQQLQALVEPPRRPSVLVLSTFGPFPGVERNPTRGVARRVEEITRRWPQPPELQIVDLPTHFEAASQGLLEHLEQLQAARPGALGGVLALGVSGRLEEIALERVAINFRQGGRQDAAGVSWEDGPLEPLGPAGLMARLPVDDWARRLRQEGWSAQVSNSAGTYVCNEVFYRLMAWANRSGWLGPAGFVHIPPVPQVRELDQVAQPIARLLRYIQDQNGAAGASSGA